jgi:hypothetical protein
LEDPEEQALQLPEELPEEQEQQRVIQREPILQVVMEPLELQQLMEVEVEVVQEIAL